MELDPAILEKYVGTYRGVYIDSTITVFVTLEDGQLMLKRNNRGEPQPLIPQS